MSDFRMAKKFGLDGTEIGTTSTVRLCEGDQVI